MRSALTSILTILVLLACDAAMTNEEVHVGEAGQVAREYIVVRWHVSSRAREDAAIAVSLENLLDRPLTARLEWAPRVCSGVRADLTLESAEKIRGEIGSEFPRLRVPPNDSSTIALPIGLKFEGGEEGIAGCEAEVRVVLTAVGEQRDEILLRVPVPAWSAD